ncbi:unnamed protein product [Symbiodinium sp. CCMP2592]|nr:unnamed protein product [Symbiodinium sp. CCMP2592]
MCRQATEIGHRASDSDRAAIVTADAAVVQQDHAEPCSAACSGLFLVSHLGFGLVGEVMRGSPLQEHRSPVSARCWQTPLGFLAVMTCNLAMTAMSEARLDLFSQVSVIALLAVA